MKINLDSEAIGFEFFKLFNQFQESGLGPYLKIILVVLFSFFIILVLARTRKLFVKSSFQGAWFGLAAGIILMILVDLIIIIGLSDKSKLEKLASGEAGPEVVKEIVFSGMSNLSRTLGAKAIFSPRRSLTAKELINDFLSMPEDEAEKVRDLLCPPED